MPRVPESLESCINHSNERTAGERGHRERGARVRVPTAQVARLRCPPSGGRATSRSWRT